jgi:hypothetical protein
MRQQILQILGEMRAEKGVMSPAEDMRFSATMDAIQAIVQSAREMDGFELLTAVRDARSVMLDIILRLRDTSVERTDRRTELEADKFWDSSMREHFVEDAEELAAKPAIRDLYKEVNEDEESGQPINDFLNNLDHDTDQDLGMFVYNMLTSDAQKATI